jgi:hypothetical protein
MTRRSDEEAEQILTEAARRKADPMSPSTPSTATDSCGSPLNRKDRVRYDRAESLNIHGQPNNPGRKVR